MEPLSRDRATPYREGVEIEYPVAVCTKIFAGSLVCTNAEGFAVPGADTSDLRLAGVALEQVDNTAGANGAKTVRVRRRGVFEFDAASITQAMVGDLMCIVDDHTFTSPDGVIHHVKVGALVKYGVTGKGWIDIQK